MKADSSNPAPARTLIHRGVKFDLELITVPGPGGTVIRREVVRHPGAAVILPILEDPSGKRVVLIRNERVALARAILELPAGTLEPLEEPEEGAKRELVEETGYEAATIVPLGRFYTSPGITDELMWAYAASGLRHVGQRLEAGERLTVHPVDAAEALSMIDRGELMDGKSIATLLLAARRGLI